MEVRRTIVARNERRLFARSPAIEAGLGRQRDQSLRVQFVRFVLAVRSAHLFRTQLGTWFDYVQEGG